MHKTYRASIADIANHYGLETQLAQAREELIECTEAVEHYARDPHEEDHLDHLAEEIADVRIMLDELEHLLGLKRRCAKWKFYKIARQQVRVAMGE